MSNSAGSIFRTVGSMLAGALIAVGIVQVWPAEAAPGDIDTTFVPLSPCRLFDYRPAPNTVGSRTTPLSAGQPHTQQVTGNVGNCTGASAVPANAVGVALNVTVIRPTAQSNLRLYPANLTTPPLVSNLNFAAGQAPVANKVDVKLSPDGKVKVLNAAGSTFVAGDVVGYYSSVSLRSLDDRLDATGSTVSDLTSDVGDLTSDVGGLAADVGDLNSDVGDLTSDISDVVSDVGGLTSDVGGLTSDVGAIEGDVEQLIANAPRRLSWSNTIVRPASGQTSVVIGTIEGMQVSVVCDGDGTDESIVRLQSLNATPIKVTGSAVLGTASSVVSQSNTSVSLSVLSTSSFSSGSYSVTVVTPSGKYAELRSTADIELVQVVPPQQFDCHFFGTITVV